MNLKMLVATHKDAIVPSDQFYLPIHVGHALNQVDLGIQVDDQGENISALNPAYCELTAIYWAWKNLDADAIGLSHYRRYFKGSQPGPMGSQIMSLSEAASLMNECDIVLASPRNYYVESIDSHYRNAHIGSDLDVLRKVVASHGPGYLLAYDRVFQRRQLSLYNMFMMRRDLFDSYAEWLFGTLAEVGQEIDNATRDAYQRRVFGFLGERLLNVWVESQRDALVVGHRRTLNTEGEPKLAKSIGLVRRKISSLIERGN